MFQIYNNGFTVGFVDVGKGFSYGATVEVSYGHKAWVPYLAAVTMCGRRRIWLKHIHPQCVERGGHHLSEM